MFSEDKRITILYYSMRHLLIPISLLFAFYNCFSNEQDRSRKAAFALFVEIPSTDIDISHAEYARDRIAAELTRLNFSIVTSDTVTEQPSHCVEILNKMLTNHLVITTCNHSQFNLVQTI